jgi:hypothetical protein
MPDRFEPITTPAVRQRDLPALSRGERPCRITQWAPFEDSGALLGKCTVAFRNGLVISGVPVFRKGNGGVSIGTPDCPLVDGQGMQLRDPETGKRRYGKVVSFATHEARERWNATIAAALADAGITGAAA